MALPLEQVKLVGHSGCDLRLEEKDERLIVVKTSKNTAYNSRLEKQHNKQKGFEHPVFQVPTVFESGMGKDNLYHFHMEYIHGEGMTSYLHTVEISSIRLLAKKFWQMIPENYTLDQEAPAIFLKKIKELEKATEDTDSQATRDALRILTKYHWEYCIAGECHGDMTLENIIIRDGELYLIDFLDSFYDSWMIDIAKLLQDLECFWSYRYLEKPTPNLEIRLNAFKDTLLEKIASLPHGREIKQAIYYILLIHLVRIVPYTKDQKTLGYLEREMRKITKKIATI